jgi:hypothetical protein
MSYGGAMTKTRSTSIACVTAALIGLASLTSSAGVAHAKGSIFVAHPSYPNSTLAIVAEGKPRAGKIVKLTVSGYNAPFEIGFPGSGEYLSYTLDVFAQNGKVLPVCPRYFQDELQNQVNLGIARIGQGLNEGYHGQFAIPIRFPTTRRVRNIVICAYSRMITDDAAVSALAIKLRRR